jgi:hypothetical protein
LSVSGKTKRVLILELDLLTKQSGEAPMEESPKQEDFEEMVKKLEEKLEAKSI